MRAPEALLNLLRQAKNLGASDVHLWVGSAPHARSAKGLAPLPASQPLERSHVERSIDALVPPALAGRLKEQGGVSFAVTVEKGLRVRGNATVTLEGPKLALRLLHATAPSFEELGLPEELAQATEHPQGLVVVTGPSGSGKTTTVAALVERINATRASHVITVEDPLEIPIDSKRSIISQREVGTHAQSFQRALKGALRQDPDVIVIGELRDVETVRIALAASETGHLVLGTMNTPNTRAVIDRLIDLFPPGDQPQVRHTLAGGLRLIANQRLVPRADGRGRIAAFEILPGSTALWNLIREDKTFQMGSLLQRGRGAGIVRLVDSLADLVKRGDVTREAADEAAPDDADLGQTLDGPPKGADGAPPPGPMKPFAEELGITNLLNKAGAIFGRKGGA